MTDFFAAVNGVRVVNARVIIPASGLWHADVRLDTATSLPDEQGACTTLLAGLSLKGSKFRAANYQGSLRARLMGGIGWTRPLGTKFYKLDAGVRASIVLGDAARELGETLSLATDRVLGVRWARIGGAPGSRLIRQIAGERWFITPDGITTIGERPGGIIASSYEVLASDGALGRFTIATETPADFAPGRTFSTPTLGPRVISCVEHVLTPDSFRTEVLT